MTRREVPVLKHYVLDVEWVSGEEFLVGRNLNLWGTVIDSWMAKQEFDTVFTCGWNCSTYRSVETDFAKIWA
jgi:hypothetical protein